MASDHTQHGRRPHGHRRRGHDRRGGDRRPRPPQQQDESAREREPRDRPDVEQIMRDIRARIAERKGIDLSDQQIQDLAARRLEAILDPEGLDPALMERLRRAAGSAPARAPEPEPVGSFDEASLYESSNGLVRALRRLFRPLLSLLINPGALAGALTSQAQLNAKRAAREAEHQRRQTEWNALHYEIVRRLVTDAARAEIERRDLLLRVESLAARVDFNDKRVATVEQAQHQVRAPRSADASPATTDGGEPPSRSDVDAEGNRRRRRRRRGRRTGSFQPDAPGSEADVDAGGEAPEAGEPSEENADDQAATAGSQAAQDGPASDAPAASPAPAWPASPPDDAPVTWPAPPAASPRADAPAPTRPTEPAEPTRPEQPPAPPADPGSDPSATDR